MYQRKPGIDIIGRILDAVYAYNPDALFVMSLMHQYEERGSLSKKQLEGLLQKARKVPDLPESWIGTLEAILLKMPNRYKSEKPEVHTPVFQKDEESGRKIAAILAKYPQHKRALFLRARLENREPLSAEEKEELNRFIRVLKIETA